MRSPVKSRPKSKLSDGVPESQDMEVSAQTAGPPAPQPHTDPFASFGTSDLPVSDTMLKRMVTSLKELLQHNMKSCFHRIQAGIQDLGDRVDHVEDKMCDYAESFNTVVEAHSAHEEKLAWLKI